MSHPTKSEWNYLVYSFSASADFISGDIGVIVSRQDVVADEVETVGLEARVRKRERSWDAELSTQREEGFGLRSLRSVFEIGLENIIERSAVQRRVRSQVVRQDTRT